MTPRSLWNPCQSIGAWVVALLVLALAAPVAAQDQAEQETITITLAEIGDSGVSGVAMLTPNGEQTDVAIRLTGGFGNHPNHIHENYCANVNPVPLLPLTHVVVGEADADGFTNSTVDISLDELLSGEYSIIVHRSDDQLDDYLVCGDISVGNAEETASAPASTAAADTASGVGTPAAGSSTDGTGVTEMAVTGVGTGVQSDPRLVIVFASLAVLAAVVAFGTSRRGWLG
jgi:hypothetical protein